MSRLILALPVVLLLQGCIAFPPLIQVEHKDSPQQVTNQEIMRRLDEIDKRLKNMEQQPAPPKEAKNPQ
jgi:starvation-inducible outer membrane lipoprotein